jgi:GNAT superfamily N-acetyltransferase
MSRSDALSWRAEHACFNAWPSLRQAIEGDWLLRFSDGLSRRANSVNALNGDAQLDIADVENLADIYRAQALPLILRVTSMMPQVDRVLDDAGFSTEGESLVLHGALDDTNARADRDVIMSSLPDDELFAAMIAMQGYTPEQSAIYQRMLQLIALPAGFATLRLDGAIAALAYGVIDRGMLCCESVIVRSDYRQRGLAMRLMNGLFQWAQMRRAQSACLQVVADNTAGRALYCRLGLATELHRYHYRRA